MSENRDTPDKDATTDPLVRLSGKDRDRIRGLQERTPLQPDHLEVMAAYRFLRKQGKSQSESIKIIKSTKPSLNERDVAIGVSKCIGIFPEATDADFESLQEEMAPWDEAAAEDEL